jgi:hypothetical protein
MGVIDKKPNPKSILALLVLMSALYALAINHLP